VTTGIMDTNYVQVSDCGRRMYLIYDGEFNEKQQHEIYLML